MTWYQNVSFLSLRIYFAKLWTNYKIKMSSSAGNTLKNGSWPVGSKNYSCYLDFPNNNAQEAVTHICESNTSKFVLKTNRLDLQETSASCHEDVTQINF